MASELSVSSTTEHPRELRAAVYARCPHPDGSEGGVLIGQKSYSVRGTFPNALEVFLPRDNTWTWVGGPDALAAASEAAMASVGVSRRSQQKTLTDYLKDDAMELRLRGFSMLATAREIAIGSVRRQHATEQRNGMGCNLFLQ